MNKYSLLGENVYFDHKRSIFSFENIEESFLRSLPLLPSPFEYAENYKITSYSICLDISNACNLNCSYCFNNSKDGKLIKYNDAINLLELFFKEFPDGQKYYVDLSGKGEPLLNLKTGNQKENRCFVFWTAYSVRDRSDILLRSSQIRKRYSG